MPAKSQRVSRALTARQV